MARLCVLGYFANQTGLANAARNTCDALEAAGHEVVRATVHTDGSLDLPKASRWCEGVIFHLNPWPEVFWHAWRALQSAGVPLDKLPIVCAPYFELPAVPLPWRRPLGVVDATIAPTRFILDALQRDVPHTRSYYSPQTASVPPDIEPNRGRFGLPHHAFVCVMSFDADSDMERKNPTAAIVAFQKAFSGDPNVRLAVRAKHQAVEPPRALLALERVAEHDPRIVLIKGDLQYDEVLSLYASSDVYISLHRAEGLGLGPMEAMALGVATMATDWSGNTDFMTSSNSVLVPAHIVPLHASGTSVYRGLVPIEHSVWAEPDLDAAVLGLRRLRADSSFRCELTRTAQSDVANRRARFMRAEFADELIADFDLDAAVGKRRRTARVEVVLSRLLDTARMLRRSLVGVVRGGNR